MFENIVRPTAGLIGTTSAERHRCFDVKADHITIAGPSGKRKSPTTSYVQNLSHDGKNEAEAYESNLKSLVIILADSIIDELK